jgi:hypothetical protein
MCMTVLVRIGSKFHMIFESPPGIKVFDHLITRLFLNYFYWISFGNPINFGRLQMWSFVFFSQTEEDGLEKRKCVVLNSEPYCRFFAQFFPILFILFLSVKCSLQVFHLRTIYCWKTHVNLERNWLSKYFSVCLLYTLCGCKCTYSTQAQQQSLPASD